MGLECCFAYTQYAVRTCIALALMSLIHWSLISCEYNTFVFERQIHDCFHKSSFEGHKNKEKVFSLLVLLCNESLKEKWMGD